MKIKKENGKKRNDSRIAFIDCIELVLTPAFCYIPLLSVDLPICHALEKKLKNDG